MRASRARFPLLLVENEGQTDADVVAYVRGRTTSVYFTKDGATYSLHDGGRRWTLKAAFAGANAGARTELLDAAPTVISYFKGPQSQWKAGLRTFRGIAYRDLWPGIDLVFRTGADELKYELVVQPGADPSRIRFAWDGAAGAAVAADGALELATPVAVLRDAAPVSFQDAGGRRVAVESAYALDEGGGQRVCGFRLGAYDPSLPLVIDPAAFLYAGYIGGEGEDVATGVAVEDGGSAFVSGYTSASEATFPRVAGPDLTQNGDVDAFVAKVAPDGASLVYVGYIGGSGLDRAHAIAVDKSAHAYVVGDTFSGQSFPFVTGPAPNAGVEDGFVAKLSVDGTSLVWCGFIGGADNDVATGVAVDKDGDVYVTGSERSSHVTFPALVGPSLFRDTESIEDAFVTKVKGDGTGFVYSGFIGASGVNDEGNGIAVDGDGAAYVVGRSDGAGFPFVTGPGLAAKGGSDAFIAKVRPDGSGFVYAGFIGGSEDDRANAVALDSQKRAYVAGTTASDETTFPVKVGPELTFQFNPAPILIRQEAFVARVTADGTGLEYCGYIGGKQADTATGIAVNDVNQAFVTGGTFSSQGSFPLIGGPGLDHVARSFEGAYLSRVKAGGSGFVTSGFIGYQDPATAIALGDAGNAYVVGSTKATDISAFPFPVLTGPDLTRNDAPASNVSDAFIAKLHSPPSQAPIDGYLLPSKVAAKFAGKATAKAAAQPKLTMSGTLDLGTTEPSWTSASTLDVGGLHFDIPAFAAVKTSHVYSAGGLTFTITPVAGGSSRAAFAIAYEGDLTGKIPSDGDLAVSFANGATTASASVRLAGGKFALSSPHGGFIEPCLFIGRAKGKLAGAGKDSLSFALGIATDGTVPAATSDVTITFGRFSQTIAAAQFKRKGSKDVFSDKSAGVTSVAVDYAKQTVTVTAKKLTLGTFAQGANTVDATVELGDGAIHEVVVQLGLKGTALTY